MKTKYSQILKIKQHIVDKIELEIISLNNAIIAKEQDIVNLKRTMSLIKPPNATIYREFLLFRESISEIRSQIEEENNFLEMLKSSKIDKLKQHKIAMIEYEKINYLHLEEVKYRLSESNKIEQKALDEISGILFQGS